MTQLAATMGASVPVDLTSILPDVAAVLTPSSDPWNQTVFALPMIGLYVLSIVIAWAVAPPTR